ncbi:ABC transporter ATP-binding protein [Cellulomonas sp. S1-8]|uniref:ABC transporter ATP-binding protein n=1 Tax=Cellulomonas sp. S1-8 TaxID=2904790 RepID=UPI002244C33C|nr:ATP-binding cassette domain-containing protein [Cellulomonas sp. S1-8]UZN02502.1 ATP-binding cassette domain-containing protein [Cellulomonas sp. S1-8]
MLVVDRLTKSFGQRTLWRDLSFTASAGDLVALTGASGSGKSTLLNCLGLLEAATSGRIEVEGRDITRLRAGGARRFRRDSVGYLFQSYALVENASVRANLEIAVGGRRRASRPALEEALDQVGLGGRGREPVYRLSGGEQQRVALARLLVRQPRVVLADEPTGSLDADNGRMVVESLRDLAKGGCAVVVATHDAEVAAACTTVVVLDPVPLHA